jgi:hypothetical protein
MAFNRIISFTQAYRAFMTALFVGIVVAFLSLVFNIIYRSAGPDFPEDLFNVSVLIFSNLLVFLLIGLVYMLLHLYAPKADLIFILLFVVLSILGWVGVSSGHFADDVIGNSQIRGFLKGLILLIGISSIGLLPFLYHSRKFEEYVV